MIINNCPNCGYYREDEIHFFLTCPAYVDARETLLEGLTEMNIDIHTTTIATKRNLVRLLIRGDQSYDFNTNFDIFELVKTFIIDSQRFS